MRYQYLALLPLIVSCTAFAAQTNAKPVTKGAVYQPPKHIKHERAQPISAVAAVRVGWDYAAVGESQTVQFLRTDPAPDLFETSQENSSRAVYGALLGIEFPLRYSYPMRWQTGVGFYQTNSFETDGIDYFFGLPEFGNIEYSYHIKNQRVLLENKFLFELHRYILGYALGGVGVSFNKAFDYEEKSLDPTTPASGVFQDNTTASLTYSVGFGLEGVVSKNFRIGLGYQYSDLGEITLGQYNNGNTGDTLSTMPTSTQEIILQFTAIF